MSGGMVDLLTRKLLRIPRDLVWALQVMACLLVLQVAA